MGADADDYSENPRSQLSLADLGKLLKEVRHKTAQRQGAVCNAIT